MKEKKFYYCKKCKNVVTIMVNGEENLICCGEVMTLLNANTVDASKEKHVPVVKRVNGIVSVNVGSVDHPMTEEHYIQWIALSKDNHMQIVWLHPGALPLATFYLRPILAEVEVVNFSETEEEVPNCEGAPCNFSTTDIIEEPVTVYAYCNLHGLWETIA